MGNESSKKNQELTLRKFIEILLKSKLLICLTVVISLLFSGVYTFFTDKPVYESRALVNTSPTQNIETPYGTFRIPFTAKEEFERMAVERKIIDRASKIANESDNGFVLPRNITTTTVRGGNSFYISVLSDCPEKSRAGAELYVGIYLEEMEFLLRRSAVNYFLNELSSKIIILENNLSALNVEIERMEDILEDVPVFINSISIVSDESDIPDMSNGIGEAQGNRITTQIINPEYSKILDQLVQLKMRHGEAIGRLEISKSGIESLTGEKEALKEISGMKYFETTMPGSFDYLANIVTLIYSPDAGLKVSESDMPFNLALGLVFGFMMGILLAYIRDYKKTFKKSSS